MFFKKVAVKVEAYVVYDLSSRVTESDVIRFYKDLGYDVYHNYRRYILQPKKSKLEIKAKVDTKIRQLFSEYKSGFPDLLLIKDGQISFVEIKNNSDHLRPSQVIFIEELAKLVDVTIAYFYNEIKDERGFIDTYNISRNNAQKEILERVKELKEVTKIKGFKPLWAIAQLCKEYNVKKIRKNPILGMVAGELNLSKNKILWFIEEKLEKQNNDKEINR